MRELLPLPRRPIQPLRRRTICRRIPLSRNLTTLQSPPSKVASQVYFPFFPNNAFSRLTRKHRLPDSVSFAEGALLEPLSVVLHGINSAHLTLGTPVLICGAGPIGLLALASARASGAHPIVITDVEPSRLAFAKEMVPQCKTYQVDISKDAEENGGEIKKLFGTREYDMPRVALECTGVESSVCTAAWSVRRGGVLMVVGVGKAVMNNLPFMHLSLAEVSSVVLFCRCSSLDRRGYP